jgi:hypothetical protein
VRAPFSGYLRCAANGAVRIRPSLSTRSGAVCVLKISGTSAVYVQPLLFVLRGDATLLKAGFLLDTLLMKTSKPTAADVIRAVAETLDVICKARGIEVGDLDEASIDRLLWSASEEHLGGGTLVFGTSWCVKRS